MLCRAMSGFYEVTAASGYGGGGRRIRSKARFGQHSRESSRRQPHPRRGVGRHRPVAFCARPRGSLRRRPAYLAPRSQQARRRYTDALDRLSHCANGSCPLEPVLLSSRAGCAVARRTLLDSKRPSAGARRATRQPQGDRRLSNLKRLRGKRVSCGLGSVLCSLRGWCRVSALVTAQTPPPDRKVVPGAVLLLLAAAFGTFIAFVSYVLLCDENCTGRSWELTWQLLVACAGLAVVALMTYFAATGQRRAADISLLIALVAYAVWAVLLDAATHGWGNGPVPF